MNSFLNQYVLRLFDLLKTSESRSKFTSDPLQKTSVSFDSETTKDLPRSGRCEGWGDAFKTKKASLTTRFVLSSVDKKDAYSNSLKS